MSATMSWSRRLVLAVALGALPAAAAAQATVGALTSHESVIPVRLTGVGLVVGLNGTGDRSLGGFAQGGSAPSARFIASLLQRFGTSVPPEVLRPRNVAAVAVQAEASPFLRPGSRMVIHVSSLQDATSLQGGQLLVTGLFSDVGDEFFVGTASGNVVVSGNEVSRLTGRGGAAGIIPDGGIVEVELPRPAFDSTTHLNLHAPDMITASRIATTINGAVGNGVAAVVDPGTIRINAPAGSADNVIGFLASIDSLPVTTYTVPKIVLNRADGSIGTVGNIVLRPATITYAGITIAIGDGAESETPVAGLIQRPEGTSVHDLVSGLHAAGARPAEIATILQMLRQAGALSAEIEIQ